MTFIRTGSIAVLLAAVLASTARAQFPPPGQFPPPNSGAASPFPNPPPSSQFTNPAQPSPFPNPSQSAFPNPGAPAGPNPQEQCNKFLPLRQEAEKRGAAISAAMQRKAPQAEACGLIRAFHDSEGRMLKFLKDNANLCGVPPEAIQQVTASHSRTAQARAQVCAASARPAAPPQPTLGEALGQTRVPDASTTRTGRGGAFDTLNGNPIAR